MRDLEGFQEELGSELSLGEGSSRRCWAHWIGGKEDDSRPEGRAGETAWRLAPTFCVLGCASGLDIR